MRQILLIDDNPLQLKVREAVLRNAGFTVTLAATVETALARLRTMGEDIGLIVTDHVMSEGSGSDLVRTLRAEEYWLPVVVLSGMPEAYGEYAGLNVLFRVKPLPPAELLDLVRTTLGENEQHARGAA